MQRVTLAAGAAAALAAVTLSGCGELNSSDLMTSMDDYCAAVQDLKDSDLSDATMTGPKLSDLRDRLSDLESKAPDSVADDYATLIAGFDQLDAALADVGLSISDMEDQATVSRVLDQASPEQVEAVEQAFDSIGTGFDAAGQAIEQEVKADCGINLGD